MLSISDAPPPPPARALDRDLRGYLTTNADIVTRITRPVPIEYVGALSAQSDTPILFDNIAEHPGFRLCDILVKNRATQSRALGVSRENYLRTLAYRLRKPPRGLIDVKTGPVKEVVLRGRDADWTRLPIPIHSERETYPYVTAMDIVRDPETGFYNTSHAGTMVTGAHTGLISFVTPHTNIIIRKYRELGKTEMPLAFCIGLHPAYEIMGNFSGLHMDMWGEMDMVGTIMDQDVEMAPCETIDLTVPAHAEIIVESMVDISRQFDTGLGVAPTMYYLPKRQILPEVRVTAITMRKERPIYRNHQSCPDTDHQPLPRLCHEAILYNRLSEMGLKVHDVRFPTWGSAISCIIQVDAPRDGFINDALMQVMGAPWLNTKLVVAVSADTNLENPAEVYKAMATRCDPSRDVIIVGNTRGSAYDPSARPLEGSYPWRIVGKMGIDATIKPRHNPKDFELALPRHWGKVKLKDFLD
jgi:2,5-furandicarboxylate decarboxylase 1